MGKIFKIPSSVVSKIRAGEVVESPVAVVKELVENSLDAFSKNIKIVIEGGGIERIVVSDDGCGMEKDDLLLALENHTTSKLRALSEVDTLGFRGEALYSIHSVSRLRIRTSTDGIKGYTIRANGGEIGNVEPAPPIKGTEVEVRSLFYNTPARYKFLKGRKAINSQIISLIRRYAISFYEVAFRLIIDKKEVFYYSCDDNIHSRIKKIYKDMPFQELIENEKEYDGFDLKIFLSQPSYLTTNKNYQAFWVNRRPVRIKGHSYILKRAFSDFDGKFPVLFCFINIAPKLVDTNVHPRKEEVAFYDEYKIYDAIISLVRRTIQKPKEFFYTSNPISVKHIKVPNKEQNVEDNKNIEKIEKKEDILVKRRVFSSRLSKIFSNKDFILSLRLIGQLFNTFFLAEFEDSLVLIDQHIAHERVLYERLLKKRVAPQFLLIPIAWEVEDIDISVIEKNLGILEEVGFSLEFEDENRIKILSIPSMLSNSEVISTLREIVYGEQSHNSLLYIYSTIACKSAIKKGDSVPLERFYAILEELAECEEPYKCPHGRDIFAIISKDEIEKFFGRK